MATAFGSFPPPTPFPILHTGGNSSASIDKMPTGDDPMLPNNSASASTSAPPFPPLPTPPQSQEAQMNSSVSGGGAASPTPLPRSVPASSSKETMTSDQPEYIQPSEFFPLSNATASSSKVGAQTGVDTGNGMGALGSRWLSPEDDKLALRGIPIFRPTLEEFEDFEAYATKTVPWGQYSGIVKIIPPEGWKRKLPPIPKRALADVKIKSPIQQHMLGQAGLFRATNVEKNKNRPLSIQEWYEKSQSEKFAGPGPNDVVRTMDRDSAAAKKAREDAVVESKRKRDAAKEKRNAAMRRKAARESMTAGQEEDVEEIEEVEQTQVQQDVVNPQLDSQQDAVPALDPSNASSRSSPDPLAKTPETNPDSEPVPEWYENFKPDTDWLPKDTKPEDYTADACAHMERKFWKTMGWGEPGWYGADLQGTLFPDPDTPWNVAHLPNLLNRLGRELPGVNVPYLYFGMWRAAFAWHVEDMDLFSINYLHFGAPKFWYAIPQAQAELFERTIAGYFPQEAANCDQFLRHKSYVMSPTKLAKDGVRVNMLVHNQGEFIITYPRGYHSGFNMGFNCAESVNFALDSWIELGRRAKVCQCVNHSVRINVDSLLEEQDERIKTEQEIMQAIEDERAGVKRRYRKRARPVILDEESGPKLEEDGMPTGMTEKKSVVPLQKKPRATIVKQPSHYPCILCPNGQESGLIPVFEPSGHVQSLCKSVDGVVRAHDACVNSTPEVWVEDKEVNGVSTAYVIGVNEIGKDRWGLKCQSCKDKKLANSGTKIQCVNGKCPKAYHVTCARDDEQVVYKVWEVEEYEPLPIPEDAPPSTQHEFVLRKNLKTEILCPNHNPDIKEAKKRQAAAALKNKVMSILKGQKIKIRTGSGSYEVEFIEASEGNKTALVQHLEPGSLPHQVKWSDIDFRPGPAQMLENEYARHHTHTRKGSNAGSMPIAPSLASEQASSQNRSHALQHPNPRSVITLSNGNDISHPRSHLIHPSTSSGNHLTPAWSNQPLPVHRYHPSQPVQSTYLPDRQPIYQYHSLPAYVPNRHGDPQHIPSRVVICNSEQDRPIYYGPQTAMPAGPSRMLPYHQQGVHPQVSQLYHPYAHQQPTYAYGPHPDYYNLQHMGSPGQLYSRQPQYQYPPPGHLGGVHIRQYSNHTSQSPLAPSSFSNGSHSNAQKVQPNGGSSPNPPGGHNVGSIQLGLERMGTLMSKLPPLQIPAIHLAGTNGKGSVSAMLEACLRASGLSVARYNSPHLIEQRRGIALNGQPPSQEMFKAAQMKVTEVDAKYGIKATLFETATAVAYVVIGEFKPDVMIIECGMGGETDATNVIPPDLNLASGLAAVGLDHTEFLGDTISKITEVKAKIAVQGGLLIVAPQPFAEVSPTAQAVAQQRGARLVQASKATQLENRKIEVDLGNFTEPPKAMIKVPLGDASITTELSLGGNHQLDNASLALTILDNIRKDHRALSIQPKIQQITDDALKQGMANATWQGRCSWLQYPSSEGIPLLVDGAHNGDSAKTLRAYIDSLDYGSNKVTWVISISESKNKTPSSVLSPLLRQGDNVILTTFSTPVEGMPWIKPANPTAIQELAKSLVGDGQVGIGDNVKVSLEEIKKMSFKERGLVVVCGSLYLVSDLYRLIEQGV